MGPWQVKGSLTNGGMRHRKKEEGPGDSGSSAEGVPLGRGSPPTSESSTKAPTSSQWTLCSCQTVAVVFGAIALVSFFFGRHLFPMIAEDVAVLKGTEKTEPPPVHEDVMEIFRLFDLLPDGKIDPVEFDHIAQYLPRRREVRVLYASPSSVILSLCGPMSDLRADTCTASIIGIITVKLIDNILHTSLRLCMQQYLRCTRFLSFKECFSTIHIEPLGTCVT